MFRRRSCYTTYEWGLHSQVLSVVEFGLIFVRFRHLSCGTRTDGSQITTTDDEERGTRTPKQPADEEEDTQYTLLNQPCQLPTVDRLVQQAKGSNRSATLAMDITETPTVSKWFRKIVVPKPPQASQLVVAEGSDQKKLYWDRSHYNSKGAQIMALHNSTTLYVGNLAFTTRTRQVQQHFSYLGPVRKVQMGLDRIKKTPCGFCFVEYDERSHALAAVAQLSGTKLDGSVIRVELDAGFQAGRQYGRGSSGGQVRHDRKEQRNKRTRGGSDDGGGGGMETYGGRPEESKGAGGGGSREDPYGPDGEKGGDESMEPSAKRRRL
jgi:nuclear cap-binding protein subunit 2